MKLNELLPSINFVLLIPKGKFEDSAFVLTHDGFKLRTENDQGLPCPMIHEIMPEILKLKGWNLPELFFGTDETFVARQNWKYAWQYESKNASDSMLLLYLERYYCEDGENKLKEGIKTIKTALEHFALVKYEKALLKELLENLKNKLEKSKELENE